MQKRNILILIFITFSILGLSQRKVVICSLLDSISDYVIWYTPKGWTTNIDKKYLFNQKQFVLEEFRKRLILAGYEVQNKDISTDMSGRLFNYFTNSAKGEFGDWLGKLRTPENIDYVIVLGRLTLPSDITNFSMVDSNLQGEDFGIVTYYGNKKKVIVYSMVQYMVFNTADLKKLNYNVHDPFISEWRKIIKFNEKVTDNGLLREDKIPQIKSELDSLFLNHINKISDLIINKQNAL